MRFLLSEEAVGYGNMRHFGKIVVPGKGEINKASLITISFVKKNLKPR